VSPSLASSVLTTESMESFGGAQGDPIDLD
jgi:hypothetical protein